MTWPARRELDITAVRVAHILIWLLVWLEIRVSLVPVLGMRVTLARMPVGQGPFAQT